MNSVSLRSSVRVIAFAAALQGTAVFAQQKGDSMEAIERALGQPTIAMNKGGNVVWSYANGRKVIFHSGVAIEVTAPLVAETKSRVVDEAEEVDEPQAARSLASLPAQKPADAALLSKRAADLAPHHVGMIEWTLRVLAIAVCAVTWTLRRPFRAAQV